MFAIEVPMVVVVEVLAALLVKVELTQIWPSWSRTFSGPSSSVQGRGEALFRIDDVLQ